MCPDEVALIPLEAEYWGPSMLLYTRRRGGRVSRAETRMLPQARSPGIGERPRGSWSAMSRRSKDEPTSAITKRAAVVLCRPALVECRKAALSQ